MSPTLPLLAPKVKLDWLNCVNPGDPLLLEKLDPLDLLPLELPLLLELPDVELRIDGPKVLCVHAPERVNPLETLWPPAAHARRGGFGGVVVVTRLVAPAFRGVPWRSVAPGGSSKGWASLVLRPHEEDGCVVLDAAVRSWPPVEPRCLRWTFPVWNPDDSLDPEALKVEGRKRKREKPETPAEEPWTVRRFVETFFGLQAVTIAEVREAAADMPGLSRRKVADLLAVARRRELVTRITLPGRGAPQGYVREPRR